MTCELPSQLDSWRYSLFGVSKLTRELPNLLASKIFTHLFMEMTYESPNLLASWRYSLFFVEIDMWASESAWFSKIFTFESLERTGNWQVSPSIDHVTRIFTLFRAKPGYETFGRRNSLTATRRQENRNSWIGYSRLTEAVYIWWHGTSWLATQPELEYDVIYHHQQGAAPMVWFRKVRTIRPSNCLFYAWAEIPYDRRKTSWS